jgi:hypothetical protein
VNQIFSIVRGERWRAWVGFGLFEHTQRISGVVGIFEPKTSLNHASDKHYNLIEKILGLASSKSVRGVSTSNY